MSIKCVIQASQEFFGYDIRNAGQQPHKVTARACVAKALRDDGLSFEGIGRLLDLHHGSVFNLMKRKRYDPYTTYQFKQYWLRT